MKLSAREANKSDIPLIIDYWYSSSKEYLHNMGADILKLPNKVDFQKMIETQIATPYSEKKGYVTIWEINGFPCGHCNINMIEFGKHANMHLHLWQSQNRKRGMGAELVKKSIPFFFKNLKLKTLICEPYALNLAPNKLLSKIGFQFIKTHHTLPGSLNFPQDVNRYEMTFEKFSSI